VCDRPITEAPVAPTEIQHVDTIHAEGSEQDLTPHCRANEKQLLELVLRIAATCGR
jgi:hypothetical protein